MAEWGGGEAEGDHRVELHCLHVLNLFVKGHQRVERTERKSTLCPKWNARWQDVGRRPLKLTAGLCAGQASAIDPAKDGRELSSVPPEGQQNAHIYNG